MSADRHVHKQSETKYGGWRSLECCFLFLQISALMDKFENQFETLDVQTAQMEDTMGNTTTLTTPQVINTVLLLQEKTILMWLRINAGLTTVIIHSSNPLNTCCLLGWSLE